MLCLAHSCSDTGFMFGNLLLLFWGVAALFTLRLLSELVAVGGPFHKATSFGQIIDRSAPNFSWLVDFGLAVLCFGMATSDLQVPGTLLAHLIVDWAPSLNYIWIRRLILFMATVGLFPVIAVRKITMIAIKDMIGMAINLYVVLIVVAYCTGATSESSSDPIGLILPTSFFAFLAQIPVFALAFCGHQNLLFLASEMRSPTLARLDLISRWSIISALVMYLIAMNVPAATYGRLVPSNFMKLLPNKFPVHMGLLANTLAIAASFPLQCYPCRRAIVSLIERARGRPIEEAEERRMRLGVSAAVAV